MASKGLLFTDPLSDFVREYFSFPFQFQLFDVNA